MFYLIVAELLVLLHFGFILFVIFGGLLALHWRWMPCLHLPAAAWGAFVEFSGAICPLTTVENHFRHAAGGVTYSGDFVEQYVMPIVYPHALTREWQIVFGLLVSLINLVIYWFVWRRNGSVA
ncbi:MAG: DUF2784 domain-containing protein [Burkholderiales bacterium]|nr:DUF2784 domain-containing protein [Burkholderiales bacterium]